MAKLIDDETLVFLTKQRGEDTAISLAITMEQHITEFRYEHAERFKIFHKVKAIFKKRGKWFQKIFGNKRDDAGVLQVPPAPAPAPEKNPKLDLIVEAHGEKKSLSDENCLLKEEIKRYQPSNLTSIRIENGIY